MKIENGRGVSPSGGQRKAGAAPAPGFAPAAEGTPRASAAGGVGGVTALDAILALQTEEPLAQRRARQARRGKDALDALERLEHGLVMGRAPGVLKPQLEGLRRAAQPTGEAGLDDILREIDTRLAVELAKLDMLQGIS
jgi:hypothetical protein